MAQLDSCGRARLLSAGGQWAGHWLQAMPTHHRLRASAATYSIALALRLGAAVPGLLGVRCGGCGEVLHDAWGRHPSACQKGNRGSLWDLRHLSLQDALLWVLRRLARCPSAQVARGNVLGSAAVTGVRADGSLSYRQLDLWVPHYVAPGRHMGIDVAVTDPLAVTALCARHLLPRLSRVARRRFARRRRWLSTSASCCRLVGSSGLGWWSVLVLLGIAWRDLCA